MTERQFIDLADVFNAIEWVSIGFLILIVGETGWDYFSRKRRRLGESMANFAIFGGNLLLERTAFGLIFFTALIVAQDFAWYTLPSTWLSWLLALLAADFTYYWMHRFEHQIRILWTYHSVHHSSPEFNLSTSLRLAWIEGAVEWVFFVPMLLIGFSAAQTIAAILIVITYQTWIHTDKIGKLDWLDRVFNTPSVHRVHHASNRHYHDKNFGGILILWDRLFGTYRAEDDPVVYGITTPIESVNPLVVNFKEVGLVWRDVVKARNWSEVWQYVAGRPGWQPPKKPASAGFN